MPVRLVSQEELPGPLRGYRLIERLGRGGFGEVWKVEAPGGLLKAAKFVFGDLDSMDEDSRPAEQELKALNRVRQIRHPYILSLERYDAIDGQLIIVMELADRNLWDRFRECRSQGLPGIPREELLRYMEEAAEALDLMNSHYQIQHLDIKPQNLFLVFNHVKVGDFGLAKLLEGVRATVTGGVTPVYAAPETFEGWVSRYSDQYSLAIVFQELITGTRPFNGVNTRQLLMQHINGTPELHHLPVADRPIIARGLSKKPDDRWPSCGEMVRALKLSGLAPDPATPHGNGGRYNGGPDSLLATRMAYGGPGVAAGGSGHLGPDPTAKGQNQTPKPPLMKPAGTGSGTTPPPGQGSTPRLVIPTTFTGPNPGQTLGRGAVLQTGRMGSLGIAPPERTGDGVLFPALVVAVGQTGRKMLEAFKRVVREQFGMPEQLPHLRCLYLDTDPEAIPEGVGTASSLSPKDFLLTRLSRPAHYLQRESLPPIEPWMPSGLLYKLSRTPGSTNGVRAFGRLALFDNYRSVVQRLRQEIETLLTDAPLTQAEAATKLGLRTNRPRAYILAGLAGGTGGGMFLDLAYLIRHELRQVGYLKPEVVGEFFVPAADAKAPRTPALGNAFAALTELHHYQARKTRYQTMFDRSEAPVTDPEPPFARVVVLPYPRTGSNREQAEKIGQASRALYQELLTPVGRAADDVRAVYLDAFPAGVPTVQTFGTFRLTWPRHEMLATATRRFAQRQLQGWAAKDAAHLREQITPWLAQQWEDRKLSLDAMTEAFRSAIHADLREDPDRVIEALIDPLRTHTPAGNRVDVPGVCSVLDQLLKLVGKPDADNDEARGSLYPTFSAEYDRLAKETEEQLAAMAVTFVEVPQYRLAGAEEAVRQIGERLKHQVEALEPLRADLEKEVRSLYQKLLQAIGGLTAAGGLGRKSGISSEVYDLLRHYPRKRLQLIQLDLCLSVYRKLHGNAPEYLREINFCRASLNDIQTAIAKEVPPAIELGGRGRLIVPDGCKNLDAAAEEFVAGLGPEDLLAFEQGLQKELSRKFRGLCGVCVKPVEKGPRFRELLMTRAGEFLDAKFDHTDPATVLFRFRPHDHAAQPLLAEAFDEAAPELPVAGGAKPYEINLLGAPEGPAGDRLRRLAQAALPNVELTTAVLPGDICFHREYPQIELTALPQMGAVARDAYQQLIAKAPAHSRIDIPWQPPEPRA